MAAVPRIALPSVFGLPVALGRSTGRALAAARARRIPRTRHLTAVGADPAEGRLLSAVVDPLREIVASWLVFLALAAFGFVMS